MREYLCPEDHFRISCWEKPRISLANPSVRIVLRGSGRPLGGERGSSGVKVQRVEESRFVAASPEKIFELICQPAFQLDTDSSGLLQSSDGETITAVGDEVVLHMGQESPEGTLVANYDVTVVVTRFTPDAALAWTIRAYGRLAEGHEWGYRLQRSAAGTLVTYYYDWSRTDQGSGSSAYTPLQPDIGLAATLSLFERAVLRSLSDEAGGGG
jgi:hypothetical protein